MEINDLKSTTTTIFRQGWRIVPRVVGVAAIMLGAIAAPGLAQSLGTNCAATIRGRSTVNLRSGPGTNFAIIGTVAPRSTVIVLNDAKELSEPSPLRQTDRQGNHWYMVTRSRADQNDGIVPPNRRAWIREDALSFSCPP